METQEFRIVMDMVEIDKIIGMHNQAFPYIKMNHQPVKKVFFNK